MVWRRLLVAVLGAASCFAAETIQIDLDAAARPFPHFWEQVFGSGRASLSMRESYRADLGLTQQALGFRYVRFHAIFHDENGIYEEDAAGRPVYNWSYVDQIYDGLLANHTRPFVELSFMPSKLAQSQTPHAFWYRPLPNPPADYDKWGALVRNFAEHLVARYGIDEVAAWYFEVWNEPNIDFWTGEPKEATYQRLYRSAAEALKRVSPRLRVGGPATAQAAWIDRFLAFCSTNHVPADFVSTHVYANDTAEDVLGTHERIGRRDMVGRAVRKVYDQVKASAMPSIPIHWTEYNASYKNEVEVTDSPFMGPWLANNIRVCDGLVNSMSYWTFSDVFEEQGVVKMPFYGGYGLIAAGGIPKAAFNAFRLLHRLGDRRLALTSESALATLGANGAVVVAVWNYADPESEGAAQEFELKFKGLAGGRQARVTIVDAQHGSPLALWERMGRPAFPTREQQQQLRKAAELPAAQSRAISAPFVVKLEPKALALVEVTR